MTLTDSASLYMTQVRFCRALAVVRSLPTSSEGTFQPSINDKLSFYGLYKQAVEGDIMLLKPSSRLVVQYAKWKAWDRMRGVSPIDAQMMYITALIELLEKFLLKYPHSELSESIAESLLYLQETDETVIADDENLVDWDTNQPDKEEYYLGNIGKNQILRDNQSSHASTPNMSTYPLTPETSPRYRIHKLSHSEDNDSVDNEVATATSSLYLSTPNQHPYDIQDTIPQPRSSHKMIQSLQEEVAALYEELNAIRHTRHRPMRFHMNWGWLLSMKALAKHTFFNMIVLLLLLIVLWRRRSPIAYAVLGHHGTKYRNLLQFLFYRVMFWKVTV